MDKSLPRVSVVTPAYNEERYLAECIDSVLAQTYANWDYTIVNNRSTDGTLAIAEKYAAQDVRIRIITNSEFIPAIANLNNAFRQISPTSKFSKMVLADDWMFPECLQRMVAVMEEHPSAGVVGAYGLQEWSVLWTGLPYRTKVLPGREICRRRLLGGEYLFGSPTAVLFRSDLVRNNDPFYDESNVHSDSEICFKLLRDCDFGFVHQVLTYSRERPGSRLRESRELNTFAHAMLHEILTYGPDYLTEEEYRRRADYAVNKYYEFLSKSVLTLRPRSFWEYHRKKLEAEGVEFSRSRVVYTFLRLLFSKIPRTIRNVKTHPDWGL